MNDLSNTSASETFSGLFLNESLLYYIHLASWLCLQLLFSQKKHLFFRIVILFFQSFQHTVSCFNQILTMR